MRRKNFFLIFAILFFSLFLVACGGEAERELDFRSMWDTELDVVISLGDSRRHVESVLGVAGAERIHRGDGHEILEFYSGMEITLINDVVINIRGTNGMTTGRFEILGYTVGMTREQIAKNFNFVTTMNSICYFANFYDTHGNCLGGAVETEEYRRFPDDWAVNGWVEWWEVDWLEDAGMVTLRVQSER